MIRSVMTCGVAETGSLIRAAWLLEIEPGRFEVVAATRSITEWKGIFGKTGKNVSMEEMNRAAVRGASASQPIG